MSRVFISVDVTEKCRPSRLKRAIQANDYTLMRFARKVGVQSWKIAKYVTGDANHMTGAEMRRIAAELNMRLEDLFKDKDSE